MERKLQQTCCICSGDKTSFQSAARLTGSRTRSSCSCSSSSSCCCCCSCCCCSSCSSIPTSICGTCGSGDLRPSTPTVDMANNRSNCRLQLLQILLQLSQQQRLLVLLYVVSIDNVCFTASLFLLCTILNNCVLLWRFM